MDSRGASKLAVLLVEDEVQTRTDLARRLAEFEVVEAGSVGEAFARLEERPDLRAAALDVNLPDGDAFSILARIRGEGLSMGVVVYSGLPWEDAHAKARARRVDDYVFLRKPFDHKLWLQSIWNAVRAAPVHRPLKEFPFDTGDACLGYFARCLVDHSGAAWHVRMDLGVDTDDACLFVAQRLRGVRLAAAARSAEVDPIVAKMLWNGLRCVWGIEDLNGILVPLGAAINTRSAGPFESSIDLGRRVAATLLAPGVVDAKTCRVFEHVVAGSTNAQLREMFKVSDAQLGRRIAAGLKAAKLARRWQVLPALAARIDGEPW